MNPIPPTSSLREYIDYLTRSQQQQAQAKPVDPFAKFDDHDLMMELIKRGYAVFLPMENLERVK